MECICVAVDTRLAHPSAPLLYSTQLPIPEASLLPMSKRIHLLGHPVSHSVSPAFQQAALDSCSIDAAYTALDVEHAELPAAVSSLRDPDVLGANVTVPHKEAVFPLLDSVSEEARLIGAVNTIHNRNGALEGHNTDARGFLSALREEAGFEPRGRTALILGAGGSARAVAVALAGEGASSVAIANRTVERAEALVELVRSLGVPAQAVALDPTNLREAGRCDLVVNCTSLGMTGGPGPGETPIPADLIPPDAFVCDLVYNPRETPLLREAATAGARTLGGLPMLVYQGVAAFEIWTGVTAPARVMFAAAEAALAARRAARS